MAEGPSNGSTRLVTMLSPENVDKSASVNFSGNIIQIA